MKKVITILIFLAVAVPGFSATYFQVNSSQIQPNLASISNGFLYDCLIPQNYDPGERAINEFREWLETFLDQQSNGPFFPMPWFDQTVHAQVVNDKVVIVTAQIPTKISNGFVIDSMAGLNPGLAGGTLVLTGVVSFEAGLTKARVSTSIVAISNGI